ncbi:MAG: hypothetical protein J6P94_00860 [Oscillospiraceae bacterium]|nr:hypothetical protein [Oscillospiraceae bacterium]
MKKVWKIVGIIMLVLVVAGIVSGGIGLLTGASLNRMVENVFGGWDVVNMVIDSIRSGELGLPF